MERYERRLLAFIPGGRQPVHRFLRAGVGTALAERRQLGRVAQAGDPQRVVNLHFGNNLKVEKQPALQEGKNAHRFSSVASDSCQFLGRGSSSLARSHVSPLNSDVCV